VSVYQLYQKIIDTNYAFMKLPFVWAILSVLLLLKVPVVAQDEIKPLVERFNKALSNKDNSQSVLLALQIGRYYYQVDNWQKALYFYKKALDIGKSTMTTDQLAGVYDTLGDLYTQTNNPASALLYYQDAADIYAKELSDMKTLAFVLFKAGNIYNTLKDDRNAINFYERAYELADENRLKVLKVACAQKLAEIYKKQNNVSKAMFYENIISQTPAATPSTSENNPKTVSPTDNPPTLALPPATAPPSKSDEAIAIQAKWQHEKELKNKIIFLAGGFGVLLITLAVLLNFQTIKRLKKQNDQIKIQNKQIEDQKRELVAEKEETERLMESILPKNIVAELKRNGVRTSSGNMVVKPQVYENCSVLFTDFKGFTNLVEQMSPEEVIEELNTCFSAFDDIIGRFSLEKIKTIGDAYMCAAGVPIACPQHAILAVSAGLEMLKFMDIYRAQKMNKGLPYFEVRIGIHSGRVIAGIVGTRKFAFDIWGDTVNTAARMEQSGKERHINISGDTYRLIRDAFDCEYRGQIPAKNKGMIDMYFVLRKKL